MNIANIPESRTERRPHMGNRIVHFEIPAGDVEKLSKFYSDLFDWKFSKQSMPVAWTTG